MNHEVKYISDSVFGAVRAHHVAHEMQYGKPPKFVILGKNRSNQMAFELSNGAATRIEMVIGCEVIVLAGEQNAEFIGVGT